MGTNIYTAALMAHNTHPDYKYDLENANYTQEGINPSCGDEMTLKLRVEDGVIEEAAFTGHGCAVSLASADIMAELITGERIEVAQHLIDLFVRMIQGDELSESERAELDEAAELESIARMPARVKCAELAWRTLHGLIEKNQLN